MAELLNVSSFLTEGIEETSSLYAATSTENDSDQVSCGSYSECTSYTCSTYGEPCSNYCNDCSDCADCADTPQTGASLTLTGGRIELTWRISGLSSSFTTDNGYVRAGITSDQFTVGGVSSISGIVAYKDATASGSTTVSQTISFDPGEYTFWGFVETESGGYWPAGTDSVTVSDSEFNWTYAGLSPSTGNPIAGSSKVSGYGIYITADEWNELVDLVNSATGASASYVSSGEDISTTKVNQVANALGISSVSSSTPISASFFNDLMDAYNSL